MLVTVLVGVLPGVLVGVMVKVLVAVGVLDGVGVLLEVDVGGKVPPGVTVSVGV